MKIYQITPYYSPYCGGLQNVVKALSEELAMNKHQVEVFTSDIGCEKGKLKSTKNLKINYLKSWEFAHTPIIFPLFWKLIRIPKDSIMHIHIAQAFVPEVVYLISKIRKIPYIAHIHVDSEPTGKFGFLLKYYKNLFLKKVLESANCVIVLTKENKKIFLEKYKNIKNVKIIPNGVSKSFFISKKTNIKNKHKNLLYVGRLSIEKNVDILLKSMAFIQNNVKLHIVGDGEQKQKLQNIISEKNIKNVYMHGRKDGKELIKIYKKSDIFLLASSYESLPLVLLEAMASENLIIASNVRGIRELIKNIGILVNPPTPKNFAIQIDKLIENEKTRKQLVQMAKNKAKEYSWNKIVEQTEQVYEEVLKEHSKNAQTNKK
ncbi:glycosyltransferase family 4 protein [Patescibacteria group bacterium]|nr:glycosyltransferase family 4 protein [Patescibacteria group bacterium]